MTTLFSTDQTGNSIEINFPPKRIVSLVPSQTEYLFDIGLNEEITGVTKYCIHPAALVDVRTKIGGTKRFKIDLIKSLNPDLIIGNKEENYQAGIESLKKHFPVWVSDIYTLQDAYSMMLELSRITGRSGEGRNLTGQIQQSFAAFKGAQNKDGVQTQIPTVAYFIWRKPYMVAASNTFINFMLGIFGVHNIFSDLIRYPEIEPDQLSVLKPDFIFLSSEPYSFGEKHLAEFQSFSPTSKVILVDGEMFSWYGSRLKLASAYFTQLLKRM